ncbi:hypothetical protein CF166_33015 [Amycolatopsis sp. KNN50.9b]|nr:hypothetical protein CF166_33015 [Amycolatopsis sp. KNN50.9b]
MAGLLAAVVLVGSGLVAGVLFAVALSVLPALLAMPADRYVYTHQLIGRRWDPTMPIIVLSSTLLDVVLALVVHQPAPVILFAVAAVVLLGVSVVSHFCNVPINRAVKSMDPGEIPDGWRDPRPLWRRWHLLRTLLALIGVALNAVAVVLV